MRNLFVRIFLFHLLVIGLFVLGLILVLDLFPIFRASRFAFTMVLSAALLLAFTLSVTAAHNVVTPLEALSRRIRNFPAPSPSALRRSSVRELDVVASELDELLHRLSSELAGHKIEKELLASLLGALREGVLCLNGQGLVLYQNSTLDAHLVAPDCTGKSYAKAIVNSALLEFVHDLLHRDAGNGSAAATTPRRLELPVRNRYYLVQGYPVKADPDVDLHLILVQDRTNEYNAQRLREDFLQNASHELKTPITSIRGYAETLSGRETREPQRSFLVGIMRNVERMEAIIEDMVTISSLESHAFPFDPQPLRASEYMKGIATLVQGALEQRNQCLALTGDDDLRLDADPLLLEHLFLNLISNASRYSPPESEISVRYQHSDDRRSAVFEVSDRGPGIPAELREKIFERFFRIDKDRARIQGGTGLGLSIVRQITRLHGGRVAVEEAPGGGALFRVQLPVRQRVSAQVAPEMAS